MQMKKMNHRSSSGADLIVKNPSIITREVVDELVLVNLEKPGSPIYLNEVAARIWALLDGENTAAEIAVIIAAEFDASLEDVEIDIAEFLNYLDAMGALSAR